MKRLCYFVLIGLVVLSVRSQISAQNSDEEGKNLEHTVTVHAEDAELSRVLALLAEKSGYNIVTAPEETGDSQNQHRISVHLDSVPISQAVNLVVRAAGLSYEIVGNSFLVASKKKLDEEVGIQPHVFHLKYAKASEVGGFLDDLTDQITIDQSGNNILVNSSPKVIDEIQRVVKEIDEPAIQIMLEARLIEVTLANQEALGIDWSKLSQLTTILAETGAPPFSGAGSLVPGVTFRQDQFRGVTQEYSPLPTGEVPQEMYFQRISGLNNIGHFSRQLTAFDVTLDFLLKNNKAEVLANSQVVTLNGRPANISMVDIVPYILSAGGVGGQVQVRREEVGIKLNILPTVNKDGFITTEVTPEVSSIFDFIGPDRNIPWVKKRVSTTTIRVKDRQSIVIAGLLGVDRKSVKHRVPFFGDLPWIGRLFRHTSFQDQKTDLIIQITPHVVQDNYTGIKKSDAIKELSGVVDDYYQSKQDSTQQSEKDSQAVREE